MDCQSLHRNRTRWPRVIIFPGQEERVWEGVSPCVPTQSVHSNLYRHVYKSQVFQRHSVCPPLLTLVFSFLRVLAQIRVRETECRSETALTLCRLAGQSVFPATTITFANARRDVPHLQKDIYLRWMPQILKNDRWIVSSSARLKIIAGMINQ